jgi:hypothetical protein
MLRCVPRKGLDIWREDGSKVCTQSQKWSSSKLARLPEAQLERKRCPSTCIEWTWLLANVCLCLESKRTTIWGENTNVLNKIGPSGIVHSRTKQLFPVLTYLRAWSITRNNSENVPLQDKNNPEPAQLLQAFVNYPLLYIGPGVLWLALHVFTWSRASFSLFFPL